MTGRQPPADNERWRSYAHARLEREYSPSSRIGGDYRPIIAEYVARSARARATSRCRRDLSYGGHPDERLDLFLAPRADAPLLVYIHGGYWQELSKAASAFAACDAIAAGCAFAAVGYTLAPAASLDRIVEQCRRAVDWLFEQAQALGVDPGRIVLAGSSAGAHLAAMSLLGGRGRGRNRGRAAAGAVLVSGIYDLRPLVRTYVNDALGLDEAAALRASPLALDLGGLPPTIVARGANETAEFARQSDAFAAALAAARVPSRTIVAQARNHFDVVLDLVRTGSPLGDATLALLHGHPDQARGTRTLPVVG